MASPQLGAITNPSGAMRYIFATTILALGTLAACDEPTPPRGPGSIRINSSASVVEPSGNFFEYSITVDNGTPRAVLVFEDESFQVNGLSAGDHTVELKEIPTACNAGALKRTVNLKGDDTALVVFDIVCPRTTGDIRVNVTTTGGDLDQDGYLVQLNGQTRGSAPSNGGTTLPFVQAGTHSVSLAGVATNCTAGAPSQVSVSAGALSTVNVTVTCTAGANVKLVVSTAGADRDPDGVTLKIGSGTPMRTLLGTSHIRVPVGQVSWELGDIQPNCTLGGASSGSFTAAAGDTVTVNASLTCAAVGYGTATTVATDAAGDTLANASNNTAKAHDVLQVTTRYAPNWLILVMRFGRPVGSVGSAVPAGLQGFIELDTDENTNTGSEPVVNAFGGNAQQGVDYGLLLFDASNTAVRLAKALNVNDTTTHRVPLALEGDSVVIRIPLAKLADDGNMSITAVLGTVDRPTELVPNSGVVLARQPTGATVAADARPAEVPAGKGRTPRPYDTRWPRK